MADEGLRLASSRAGRVIFGVGATFASRRAPDILLQKAGLLNPDGVVPMDTRSAADLMDRAHAAGITGVDDIDAQHRELFERIGTVLEASRARRSREEVIRLLEFLRSYFVYHFAAEERTMETAGYPRLEAHRRVHALCALPLLLPGRAADGAPPRTTCACAPGACRPAPR